MYFFTVPNIRISVDPLGIPVPGQGSGGGPGSGFGSTYTFQYFVGADLNLSCLATPPPPIDIPYRWICSTGCFADMETTQNISVMGLNVSDSGSIFCGVNLIGVDFFSQSFGLQVIMMGKVVLVCRYICCSEFVHTYLCINA